MSALRKARENRGWSLDHVAALVGVSNAQIWRIEHRGVKAASTALALAKLFDGEVDLEDVCFPRESVPTRKTEIGGKKAPQSAKAIR